MTAGASTATSAAADSGFGDSHEGQVIELNDAGKIVIEVQGIMVHLDAAGNRVKMEDGQVMEDKDGSKLMMKNKAIWETLTEHGTLKPRQKMIRIAAELAGLSEAHQSPPTQRRSCRAHVWACFANLMVTSRHALIFRHGAPDRADDRIAVGRHARAALSICDHRGIVLGHRLMLCRSGAVRGGFPVIVDGQCLAIALRACGLDTLQ
jgi:hypothetical protein